MKSLTENKGEGNTFQVTLEASTYYPHTQTTQRPLKRRKLETDICHEFRCKNIQQILANSNQQSIQELYIIMKWDFMQKSTFKNQSL